MPVLFLLTIFSSSLLQVGLGEASWVIVLQRMVSDIYARLMWRLAYTMFRE
jgi:hypothetical protein